jgi:hypothetical protein
MTDTALHTPWETVDLDDMSRCPVCETCESCPDHHDLTVETVETLGGVLCVTLCRPCWQGRSLPDWSAPAAAQRVCQHCQHLGISRDDMTVARARKGFDQRELWLPGAVGGLN